MQDLRWDDIRFFLAVAREGSVTRAAQVLGVNYTTVARRITALEREVDARLFERLPTGHVMTAAAETIFDRAQAMDEQANALTLGLQGQDARLSGRLRLAIGDLTWSHLILPHIHKFLAAYPDIALDVVSADQPVDLAMREADIAVRVTVSELPPDMMGVHIAKLKFGAFGHREYLLEHQPLDSPDTTILLWDAEPNDAAWWRPQLPNATAGPTMNNAYVMVASMLQKLGVGAIPYYIAALHPDLELVGYQEGVGPEMSLWLLHHPDLRTTARVRVFRDFLKEILFAQRDLVTGISGWNSAAPPAPFLPGVG